MINDLHLFLDPILPARIAYFAAHPLSELIGKWRKAKGRTFLATMFALDRIGHLNSPWVDYSRTLGVRWQSRRVGRHRCGFPKSRKSSDHQAPSPLRSAGALQ